MSDLEKILLPLSITCVTLLALLFIRKVLLRFIERSRLTSATALAEYAGKVLRVPSLYWCIALSLQMGIIIADPPLKYAPQLSHLIYIFLMASVAIALSSLLESLSNRFFREIKSPIASSGLAKGAIRFTVYTILGLTVLDRFGIAISPLITALGIGGLAVALACKDTLENLFAGIGLLVDKAIQVGDSVRLEWGQEGVIQDIGWRTTKIKLSSQDTLVIPNLRLSQSFVIKNTRSDTHSVAK